MQPLAVTEQRDVVLVKPGIHLRFLILQANCYVQLAFFFYFRELDVNVKIFVMVRGYLPYNALYRQFSLGIIDSAIEAVATGPYNYFYFLFTFIVKVSEFKNILIRSLRFVRSFDKGVQQVFEHFVIVIFFIFCGHLVRQVRLSITERFLIFTVHLIHRSDYVLSSHIALHCFVYEAQKVLNLLVGICQNFLQGRFV